MAPISQLGFGTFRMPEAEVISILPKALQSGFNHVDTAQIYENEAAVGEAIRTSGIARDSIFLTTRSGSTITAGTASPPPSRKA